MDIISSHVCFENYDGLWVTLCVCENWCEEVSKVLQPPLRKEHSKILIGKKRRGEIKCKDRLNDHGCTRLYYYYSI